MLRGSNQEKLHPGPEVKVEVAELMAVSAVTANISSALGKCQACARRVACINSFIPQVHPE